MSTTTAIPMTDAEKVTQLEREVEQMKALFASGLTAAQTELVNKRRLAEIDRHLANREELIQSRAHLIEQWKAEDAATARSRVDRMTLFVTGLADIDKVISDLGGTVPVDAAGLVEPPEMFEPPEMRDSHLQTPAPSHTAPEPAMPAEPMTHVSPPFVPPTPPQGGPAPLHVAPAVNGGTIHA
jgi:hypothetical protein